MLGEVPARLESELLNPGLVQAVNGLVVVYDYGDQSVKAFDLRGRLVWSLGRRGAGPGEFRNPTDLQVGPDGTIWVTDPVNLRVSVIRRDGRFVRHIRTPSAYAKCIPLSADECLAVPPTDWLSLRIDTAGRIHERLPLPRWLVDVHPMGRDATGAPLRGGGGAVIAFLYSDRYVLVRWHGGDRLHTIDRRGIEPIEFARVLSWTVDGRTAHRIDPDAYVAARSVGIHADTYFVLVAGRDEGPTDLIDTYDLRTGEYAGSIRLPEPVHRMAIGNDGEIAALVPGPAAAIRVWRFQPAH